MHPLLIKFAQDFNALPTHEREPLARQVMGFIGSFLSSQEAGWTRILFVDGEGALGKVSALTLIELLNENLTLRLT